jgi:hypothetical protein
MGGISYGKKAEDYIFGSGYKQKASQEANLEQQRILYHVPPGFDLCHYRILLADAGYTLFVL